MMEAWLAFIIMAVFSVLTVAIAFVGAYLKKGEE